MRKYWSVKHNRLEHARYRGNFGLFFHYVVDCSKNQENVVIEMELRARDGNFEFIFKNIYLTF